MASHAGSGRPAHGVDLAAVRRVALDLAERLDRGELPEEVTRGLRLTGQSGDR